jgi:hypothetical protein
VCFLINSITGLTAIVRNNCTENEPRIETNLAWSDYVNPCGILLLYSYFAFETNRTYFHRVNSNNSLFFLLNDFCSLKGTIKYNNNTIC